MRVMALLIVSSLLGTIWKGFEKGFVELKIRERIETIKAAAMLRSARRVQNN